MSVYNKVFGYNHGKDLKNLSVEDQKKLHDFRKEERARRTANTKKIVHNNMYVKNK